MEFSLHCEKREYFDNVNFLMGKYENFALICWITLHYKIKNLDAEWDISTGSTSLGPTDTQMKTCFAPLAHIFPQNHFFAPFLR